MSRSIHVLILVILFLLMVSMRIAQAQKVEVLWLGHATTRITSVEGKVIIIDPYLKNNPLAPAQYRDLEALGKVDLILVTHGHGDHAGDLRELARLSGAKVVVIYEYGLQLSTLGILDASKVISMNKGGTVTPLGRDIKIHMVPAEHSSSINLKLLGSWTPDSRMPMLLAGGAAVGFVVELENGFKIYHSGDTHVFGDMDLINRFHAPDLALVCIGGYFTMDPERAAYAVRELIKPKQVIPIHYGTYPIINRTPEEFRQALGDAPIEVLDVKPGQTVEF